MGPVLIAVMGPTASGKTALAERLADEFDAQLINADAFQVYRGMDIGTGKSAFRERYALMDLRNPDEGFGVGEFVRLATLELERLFALGRSAVVVGGTGLYVRALFEEYGEMAAAPDPRLRERLNQRLAEEGVAGLAEELVARAPERAAKLDLRNPARVIRALERLEIPAVDQKSQLPPFVKRKLALNPSKDAIETNISQRVRAMVQNGWVGEVQRLRRAGYGPQDPGFRAIGYRTLWEHLEGEFELEEAIATTIAETRRYAKRQRTWLRSEPNLIVLGESEPFRDAAELVRDALK